MGGAGLGIRGVSFGDRSANAEQGSVGVRHNDSVEGNDSILRLLKYVCKVLGINLEAVKLVDADSDGPTDAENEDGESPDASISLQPDDDVLDPSHDVYGWPELQIGVIREAIAVAESLPGQSMSGQSMHEIADLLTCRLPHRSSNCTLSFENNAPSIGFRGPVSPLCDICPSTNNSSTARRHEADRVLGWTAYC